MSLRFGAQLLDLRWAVSPPLEVLPAHVLVGRDVLEDQREHGAPKRLVGFRFADRTIGRHGYPMRGGGSEGRVTSGNFSPTLEVGIGLGYLTPDPGEIDSVDVEVRGAFATATYQDPPFI